MKVLRVIFEEKETLNIVENAATETQTHNAVTLFKKISTHVKTLFKLL